jgi:hypothetical protein
MIGGHDVTRFISSVAASMVAILIVAACGAPSTPSSATAAPTTAERSTPVATSAPPTTSVKPSQLTDTLGFTLDGSLPTGWSLDGSTFWHSDNAYVELLPDRSLMAADCDLRPEAGVGRTAMEIATALAARDGLATTEQKTVTIGGLSGQQIDITIRPGWTKACPSAEDDTPMVPLVGALDEKNLWNFNAATPGEQYRYLILDAPGRHNLLVSIYALEPERLDKVVIPAMEIANHLRFTPS